MPYKYITKKRGPEIIAQGQNYEEVFMEGARALFDLMVDAGKVRGRQKIEITVQANSMQGLYLAWLKELLVRKEVNQMMFGEFRIASIQKVDDKQYLLMGFAFGEAFDSKKLE